MQITSLDVIEKLKLVLMALPINERYTMAYYLFGKQRLKYMFFLGVALDE